MEPLTRVLRRFDPEQRLHAYRVFTFWDHEVGPAIAERAQPVALRAGVLTVAVNGPTWIQELQFLKDDIRARLNTRLGRAEITDIFFVPGEVTPPRREHGYDATRPDAEVAVDIPPLRNPELRAAFEHLARTHNRRVRGES